MPESRKQRLLRLLEAHNLRRVDEGAWKVLTAELAPVSSSYLRTLIEAAGVPIDPPWSGVKQHTFDELAESLCALEREYTNGGDDRKRLCRELVIEAKARARRAAATSDEETRERKREMIEWMLVWLENPGVFPVWIGLRRR
jgi:hypothetical protein